MKSHCVIGVFVFALIAGDTAASQPRTSPPKAIELAADGVALVPIIIDRQADAAVEALARELVDGLRRLSGVTFEIVRDGRGEGIIVGTDRDRPGILPAVDADLSPRLAREDYVLRSSQKSLLVVGRETIGLQNAVWDFFHRLGFRHYFPGPKWELWPRSSRLSIGIDAFERPDYYHRRFMFTGQAAPSMLKKLGVPRTPEALRAEEQYRREIEVWQIHNRLVSGFELNTSHAYGEIVRRNPEHFAAHLEDIVSRETGETRKLDAARATLLDVAARDALRQFAADPQLDSVSVEPSDGGGWRADSPLGKPTNQALTLANHVARAVRVQFPGRKVGMLAYNEHSPPPDFEVDRDVVISVATAFLRGGLTVDQLIDGWRPHGAVLGIREYLSIYGWSRDLPGRSRADDWNYLVTTIPHFHEKGARYWKSEVSRTWFPHGMGYYLATRLLWDTDEAARAEAIAHEFYRRSFGAAADEMKQFHERYLFVQGRPLMSEDLVGRMYRLLSRALDRADSTEAKQRIADYVAYVRYIELTLAVDGAGRDDGGAAARQLAEFEFRFRNTPVVNAGGYYRLTGRAGKSLPAQANEKDEPFSLAEAGAMIRRGIDTNRVTAFEPVAFSGELVPLTDAAEQAESDGYVTIVQTTQLWLFGREMPTFKFTVLGNQIYANRGPIKLRLFAVADPLVDHPTAALEVPAEKQSHDVELTSSFSGLHRLEASDGGAGTRITWPAGQHVVWSVGAAGTIKVPRNYKFDGVFYVPRGTKVVGGYATVATGKLFSSEGHEIFDFKSLRSNSYFEVPVPPGEDQQCRRVSGAHQGFTLLTVPPYLSRTREELLVPVEAIKK